MPTLLKLTVLVGLCLSLHLMAATVKAPGDGPATSMSLRFVSTSYKETIRSLMHNLFITLIFGRRFLRIAEPRESVNWLKDFPPELKALRLLRSTDCATRLFRFGRDVSGPMS